MEEKNMSFSEKIENFWYHYKWQTIIAVFFAVTFAICITQCAKNSEPDAMIMYAGNYAVPDDYKDTALESIMSEDYNGDGEKRADVFQLVLNIVEKGGEYGYYDAVGQNEELQRLEIEFYTGQSVIYILHPFIYEQYKNIMVPIGESFGSGFDDILYDESAVRLSELAAYADTTLGFYPSECVLCVRNPRLEDNLVSKADDADYYEANLGFFKELLSYSAQN